MKKNKKEQEQSVTNKGLGFQAGRDLIINNQGITYSEAKDIAMDVFHENFYKLSGEAKHIAEERAIQITEEFLNNLQIENPEGLNKANNPNFQYSLFTLQKNYSRYGNKETGDLLVRLLIEICAHEDTDPFQRIIIEALETTSRLNIRQISDLSLKFIIGYFNLYNSSILNMEVKSRKSFFKLLDKLFLPLINDIDISETTITFLEFCKCIDRFESKYEMGFFNSLRSKGEYYFQKSFSYSDLIDFCRERIVSSITIDFEQIIQKLIYPDKDQPGFFKFIHNRKEFQNELKILEDNSPYLISPYYIFYNNNFDIDQAIDESRPYFISVQKFRESFKPFSLSLIGIAIGHANLQRLNYELPDLKSYIE